MQYLAQLWRIYMQYLAQLGVFVDAVSCPALPGFRCTILPSSPVSKCIILPSSACNSMKYLVQLCLCLDAVSCSALPVTTIPHLIELILLYHTKIYS